MGKLRRKTERSLSTRNVDGKPPNPVGDWGGKPTLFLWKKYHCQSQHHSTLRWELSDTRKSQDFAQAGSGPVREREKSSFNENCWKPSWKSGSVLFSSLASSVLNRTATRSFDGRLTWLGGLDGWSSHRCSGVKCRWSRCQLVRMIEQTIFLR